MDLKNVGKPGNSKKIYDLYDYYGIDYSIFNDSEKDKLSQNEIDQWEATEYILEGKEVPEDLAARLLKYKAEKENQGGK